MRISDWSSDVCSSDLAAAVELLQAGEGNVGDVEVQPHADRVGRDEIIDLARLEHRDLRIAGPGAERTHDDRRAASETAQHLGDRIDLLGRVSDDRRALGGPRQLQDRKSTRLTSSNKSTSRIAASPLNKT